MSMQYYFGDDDDPRPRPSEPPAPIEEIGASLRVVRRLADELPPSAHTSRLSVAVEAAQAAVTVWCAETVAAHLSQKRTR